MAFFDFLKKDKKPREENRKNVLTLNEMVKELGVAREQVIGSYETEENPDNLGPETYIQMQENDGEVQAIVRLLTIPIISTPFHILPSSGDKGERDFIETIFLSPPKLGGMTTPIPFVIADMTRAIFEGFRVYEKVARIIEEGKYKGKIGWKKLAPRDARTVSLKADEHGGFDGIKQEAFFGNKQYSVSIPAEKCMLFTFQKEKQWLYGESILKTAFYHYEKKHKLYYIAHKKAEIESLGLKILKIGNTMTSAQRTKAEETVDQIGVNSRVTLPPGVDLEIQRGGSGYDPLPLIEHHNLMMSRSALTQAVDQVKYAYPYGKGTASSQFLILFLESIMNQMAETLNSYAIAPLIDFNFGTSSYPKLKFEKISDPSRDFLKEVFSQIMKAKTQLPEGFVNQIIDETAKNLNLKWTFEKESKETKKNKEAFKSFEKGKIQESNKLGIKAPSLPEKLKEKLLKIEDKEDNIKKCYELGKQFAHVQNNGN